MHSRTSFYITLMIVVFFHVIVIAVIFLNKKTNSPPEVVPPAIEGVIIAPPEPEQTSAPVPVPNEQKNEQKKPVVEKVLARSATESIHQSVPIAEEKPVVTEPKQAVATPTETVSDDVILPHTDASHINNPAPVYPALSRRNKEEGVVLLSIVVLADGSVTSVRVKASSGYSRLDQAAITAVKNWHFVAAKKGAVAIDYEYELPIEFSLK